MERAQQTPSGGRRRVSSPRIAYTVGGLLTVGTVSALTVATVLSSPQLKSVPVGPDTDATAPIATEHALAAPPSTTIPPRRGIVIPVQFPTPQLRPVPAQPEPHPQVLGTQFARPQPRPAPPRAAARPAPAPAPAPAPSRCGSGNAVASLVTQSAPTSGTTTTDYTTTLSATVANHVTNAIQMDELAILVTWADGSSQLVPLSQAPGSVIQSDQSGSYVGTVHSATPPSSFTIQQFAWHVAGAPQCAGH